MVVTISAHDGGSTVGGQRDGVAQAGTKGAVNRTGANQLAALLGPCIAGAGVDPDRPGARDVADRASTHPPTMAVLPSADSATESLVRRPNSVVADQLAALLGPDTVAARVDPRRPDARVVTIPADDGRVAVGGQRNGEALLGASGTVDCVIADQLAALLGPNSAAAGEDPCRPDAVARLSGLSPGPPTMAVLPSADSATEWPCSARYHATPTPGADQLAALLGPDAAAAREDPRGPGPPVVARPAHDRRCCRRRTARPKCLACAVASSSNRAGADQLAALLGPNPVAAGEDPGSPIAPVVTMTRPRWRCCRRRTARRRILERIPQPRRCRPASAPAGSRHRRCGCRPTPPRMFPLSPYPPTMAVLPSADSATDQPCAAVGPTASLPTQLRPLLRELRQRQLR